MNNMSNRKPVEILLVEDNAGDVRLAKEAFKESGVRNTLHVTKDGVEAMNFLRKRREFKSSPSPDMILLDLNLPKKDGREVLAEIKADKSLKKIPVIILTISNDEKDIMKSYELHANCYITKPLDLYQFMNVVKSVEDFWLKTVKLPPN